MKHQSTKDSVPAKERFHNLVSSGLVSPRQWIDSVGVHHYAYFIDENKDAVRQLDSIRAIVMRIAKSKEPPWMAFQFRGGLRYKLSGDARRLWHVIRGVDLVHKAWGREKEMHPYVALGVRLFRKWEPHLRWYTNPNAELMISEELPRRIIWRIVRVIRRVCSSGRFVNRVRRLDRQRWENFRSCGGYVLSILRDHARPLVLRADFYLEGQAKSVALERKVERAVQKLIRNLRESRIIPDILGYIVKRENAYDRGMHLHVMVFVDGNLHSNTYGLTEMLIAYWIYECVGSPELASGFNCYNRKDEYLFNGLGHVHYADENALRGVRDALLYLSKTDGHFLLPDGFGKSLRKGQEKPLAARVLRRGAPRKHSSHLEVARRILMNQPQPMRDSGGFGIARA